MLRQKTVATGVAFVFFLAMGVMFRADPVLADEEDEEEFAAAIEEVRVEAPVVTRRVTARGPSGYTTEVVQLRRQVSYADLDLAEEKDVEELDKRIEMSAREACEALKQLFPKGQKNAVDVYRCTKHAIENSEESFESAVAAAN